MKTVFTHKDITWIDIENPTRNEVLELMEHYHINPLCAEELLVPTVRSKVDRFADVLYVVLHFPHVATDTKTFEPKIQEQEIDFVIGKNFLITVRYGENNTLFEFGKSFQVSSMLDHTIGTHAGMIFYFLAQSLYRDIERTLEVIKQDISWVERKIFSGEESKTVKKISEINRVLLNTAQSIRFHEDVLLSFEHASQTFFESQYQFYIKSLLGEYYRVIKTVKSHEEFLHNLRITGDSLLSTKNNEIIKNLTVMSFVTFPLTLIAGVFGMNAKLPFVESPFGFWIIIIIMLSAMIGMFAYFHYKNWL